MDETEEPGVPELFAALAKCLRRAVPLNRVVFRSATLQYANENDFLSGVGAAIVGGRWNPRGVRAVYASLTPNTAVSEAYQNLNDYGFPLSAIRPRVVCGATVALSRLLDLTDARIRHEIGFSLNELLEEEWLALQQQGEESWTQAIGRGARAAGFEGLIAPSARDLPDGVNLVYFPEYLQAGSHVILLGADELPPAPVRPT